LLEGDIDVGVMWLPVPAAEGIQVETALEEPLVAALPADHPLATKEQVALEDLADDPFVLFARWINPGSHDVITGACREAGFVPQVVEANTLQGTVSMVATGIGVALVTQSASESVKRPRVVYKEIADLDFRAKAGLAWRSEDERPVAKRFPEVVLEACRTYSSERKAVGG